MVSVAPTGDRLAAWHGRSDLRIWTLPVPSETDRARLECLSPLRLENESLVAPPTTTPCP
jgi:hypothetical protein